MNSYAVMEVIPDNVGMDIVRDSIILLLGWIEFFHWECISGLYA